MNNTLISYISAFLVGGVICSLGQILIDKTKLTPARILVLFVTVGVFLTALGLYQKVVDIGGAGATIPLTGFGYSLAKGTFSDVDKHGLLGAFTGNPSNCRRVSAAIVGYLVAVIFKPKAKA